MSSKSLITIILSILSLLFGIPGTIQAGGIMTGHFSSAPVDWLAAIAGVFFGGASGTGALLNHFFNRSGTNSRDGKVSQQMLVNALDLIFDFLPGDTEVEEMVKKLLIKIAEKRYQPPEPMPLKLVR